MSFCQDPGKLSSDTRTADDSLELAQAEIKRLQAIIDDYAKICQSYERELRSTAERNAPSGAGHPD